jgi:glutamate 5-kinase
VPVVNENDSVATAELKLGDNDTLSAWVAYLVDADLLVLLTDVDGLYDRDPRRHPDARRIEVVDDLDAVAAAAGATGDPRGTGGMVTKLRAARIAQRAGIETLIGGGGGGLEALARGEVRGTRFLARRSARPARRGSPSSRCAGASRSTTAPRARPGRGRSLLPSGVVAASGAFAFGDAVDVVHAGVVVGRGLVNYGTTPSPASAVATPATSRRLLGAKDFDEVVHRDQLVWWGPSGTMPAS